MSSNDSIAYVRLSKEAVAAYPETNYTFQKVPGRQGPVSLTPREPVLVGNDGKALGVPTSWVQETGIHREKIVLRGEDGEVTDRVPRFSIARNPFEVPAAPKAKPENVFNAAGDIDAAAALFNTEGDEGAEPSADVAADAEPNDEAPVDARADVAPAAESGKAPKGNTRGNRRAAPTAGDLP